MRRRTSVLSGDERLVDQPPPEEPAQLAPEEPAQLAPAEPALPAEQPAHALLTPLSFFAHALPNGLLQNASPGGSSSKLLNPPPADMQCPPGYVPMPLLKKTMDDLNAGSYPKPAGSEALQISSVCGSPSCVDGDDLHVETSDITWTVGNKTWHNTPGSPTSQAPVLYAKDSGKPLAVLITCGKPDEGGPYVFAADSSGTAEQPEFFRSGWAPATTPGASTGIVIARAQTLSSFVVQFVSGSLNAGIPITFEVRKNGVLAHPRAIIKADGGSSGTFFTDPNTSWNAQFAPGDVLSVALVVPPHGILIEQGLAVPIKTLKATVE